MRYKLIVQKIVEMTSEEKEERKRNNTNNYPRFNEPFGNHMKENEVATLALDVEITEEQWSRVRSAVIKEV